MQSARQHVLVFGLLCLLLLGLVPEGRVVANLPANGPPNDLTQPRLEITLSQDLSQGIALLNARGIPYTLEDGQLAADVSQDTYADLLAAGLTPCVVGRYLLATVVPAGQRISADYAQAFGSEARDVPIPDNNTWVESTITISTAPEDAYIVRLDVHIEIIHTYLEDLFVQVRNEAGSLGAHLCCGGYGSQDNLNRTWIDIGVFDGRLVNQTWRLRVQDTAPWDTGYIDSWWLKLYYETGDTPTPRPTATPTRTPYGYNCLSLQQGVSAYAGCSDTTIDSWAPYANRDGQSLYTWGLNVAHTLIDFDLAPASLPPNAVIDSAVLSLETRDRSNSGTSQVYAYPVNLAWVASEATWRQASATEPWHLDGCSLPGSDYVENLLDKVIVDAEYTRFEWDIRAAVQSWVDQTGGHFGVILKAERGTSVRYNYVSADYPPSPLQRPRLDICYHLGDTPTPSPSPTESPTATPSITLTPSATPSPSPTSGTPYPGPETPRPVPLHLPLILK